MEKLKILVGYHKPARLLKGDIYVPIHLGRAIANQASKDGLLDEVSLNWLTSHLIGDDTGDNISSLNRFFCELTGIYWAWKNYDQLGDPNFIGFMHYRRLFSEADISSSLNFDITASPGIIPFPSIREQFPLEHPATDLDEVISLLNQYYPDYSSDAQEYLDGRYCFYFNMFIMRKEYFFEYCDFLFKILFIYAKDKNFAEYSYYNSRLPGFLAERLTGIFIYHKKKQCRFKEVDVIMADHGLSEILAPVNQLASAICFIADDQQAPYLSVAIASIKENRKPEDIYDICILDEGISARNKRQLQGMSDEKFSIRFLDPYQYTEDILPVNDDLVATRKASFWSLVIPKIFRHYNRVLYLGNDLVAHHDVSGLFSMDMGGRALAASRDIEAVQRIVDKQGNTKDEIRKTTFHMKYPERYLESGVLLFDIPQCQSENLTQRLLQAHAQLIGQENTISRTLNAVVDGDYYDFGFAWNVSWHDFGGNLANALKEQLFREYNEAYQYPQIIHYASGSKPWLSVENEWSEVWWNYARNSPFYEHLLFSQLFGTPKSEELKRLHQLVLSQTQYAYVLSHMGRYNRLKLVYKLKKFVYRGPKREKYVQKYGKLKQLLREARSWKKTLHS